MTIDVVATAHEASTFNFSHKIAVVIDVLRATSVMTIAMHNGAKHIIAVRTTEEAFALRKKYAPNVLLGGERNADKIEGFDLDNSPRRYTHNMVNGKTIVMTTTNGTQAIAACTNAQKIYIASLLNASNIAKQLVHANTDIAIVCAGTEGQFSLEDGLCAGLIANELSQHGFTLTDMAQAMKTLSQCANIKQTASIGEHFARLQRKGYEADIDVCFDLSKQYEALVYGNEGVVIENIQL